MKRVLVCGLTDCGALGTGRLSHLVMQPQELQLPTGHELLSMSVGQNHCLAVLSSLNDTDVKRNSLWAFGQNTRGQLGCGDRIDKASFVRVVEPAGLSSWLSVAAGTTHSMATLRDIDGQTRTFGFGDNRVRQISDERSDTISEPVEALSSPVAVACGNEFTVAAYAGERDDVSVVVRGRDDLKQRGGFVDSRASAFDGRAIKRIALACGWAHTVAYTDRFAYAWGSNKHGQCGIKAHDVVSTATRITLPALHTIDRIVCGATHCMALLRDQRNHGHVYVWGSHGDGKLGLEVTEDVFVPTRLPIDHSMRDVVCGGDHSFVITEENQVFAWGFLQHAVAFGLERCTQATPRHVPALDGVHQIAAGLDVSFAMFK